MFTKMLVVVVSIKFLYRLIQTVLMILMLYHTDVADAQNIHLCTWRFLGICYQDQVLLGLQNAVVCIHLH